MEEPARLTADGLLGLPDRLDQWLGVLWIGGTEMQLALERLPRRAGRLRQAELRDGGLRMRAELLVGHRELGRC
jgi:hypothetical protein